MPLCFALDATWTDPGPGITRGLAHALEQLGRPVPALSELERFIGPPLKLNFAELLETGTRFAQGRLFGEPRPVLDEILDETTTQPIRRSA
mgnify:CR=1 FL=1